MKNLLLIAVFTMISIVAFGQKEVKVEKEIENGKETTRVWIDGKEVKEGSAEYKKYAEGEIMTDGNVKIKNLKRKGKKGEEEKVIIIKKEMANDVIVIGDDEEMEINVDVKEDGDNRKVIIKTKGKDGKEEVEEIIIDSNDDENFILDGDSKVIIKTRKDMDLDFDGIDPEDIETVDVTKKDGTKIITIKTKDGKTIVKEMKGGNEDVKVIKKRIRTEKTEDFDFDLDGLEPETIETIDVKKNDNGEKTVIIKTKDDKIIVKKIKSDNVKVIKKEKD